MSVELTSFTHSKENVRLETLVKVRWLAIAGQLAAVFTVWLYLGYEFAPIACLVLIGASAFLNIYLRLRHPANVRLSALASTSLLAYDIIQLAALLYLTGGLQNPFAILLAVPVVISSTALSVGYTLFLGGLAVLCTTLLAFLYYPLPWISGEILRLPNIYIGGMWIAIVSTLTFTAIYAFRVADEARSLADALTATELVLQREQHLSNLDGLAAAAAHERGTPLATIAPVSKEMMREVQKDSQIYDDATLLRSQAERCREILKKLTSLSSEGDRHISEMKFTAIMEEVAAPLRDFGVEVIVDHPKDNQEPICLRNPGILYGLGNLLENAVDYANSKVAFTAGWDSDLIWVTVNDDGVGYGEDLLERIGEPFVKDRNASRKSGGLGLGLFIAKTLLERSGASLSFSNAKVSELKGALVRVEWPRAALDIYPDKFSSVES